MKLPPGFFFVVNTFVVLKYKSTGMVITTITLPCLFSFLFVNLSVCLYNCFVFPSVSLNVFLSACTMFIPLLVCLTFTHFGSFCLTHTFSLTLSLVLSISSCMFCHLSVCPFVFFLSVSVCLSVFCLSVYMSVCLYVCLFLFPSL